MTAAIPGGRRRAARSRSRSCPSRSRTSAAHPERDVRRRRLRARRVQQVKEHRCGRDFCQVDGHLDSGPAGTLPTNSTTCHRSSRVTPNLRHGRDRSPRLQLQRGQETGSQPSAPSPNPASRCSARRCRTAMAASSLPRKAWPPVRKRRRRRPRRCNRRPSPLASSSSRPPSGPRENGLERAGRFAWPRPSRASAIVPVKRPAPRCGRARTARAVW